MRRTRTLTAAAVLMIFLAISLVAAEAATKVTVPPYKNEGPVSGTGLEYDTLLIAANGKVSVTIDNPTKKGMNFDAAFSFFSAKGVRVCGFSIQDYIAKGARKTYSLSIPDYRNLNKAAYMKVLGRAGIASDS